MGEKIVAVVLFALAVTAFVLSVRAFCEKGFLLNNAYLYASPKERETMDKKPYYRQSGVVFLLVGVIFALHGCGALFRLDWMSGVATAVMVITLCYAVGSAVAIEKKKKQS